MEHLKHHGIECAFHYVPLHLSQAGKKYARCGTPLSVTENVGAQLVRLPLWLGIEEALPYIIENVQHVLHEIKVKNHV
jgi:dTDP-4-amino-4,6-dideoxygalactose transaminase